MLLADPEQGRLEDVVDLDRYPIGDTSSGEQTDLISHVRQGLGCDGAVTLTGFLRPAALRAIASELTNTACRIAIRRHRGSVYARNDLEATLHEDDPRRAVQEWNAGHVTRDMIPPYSPAHRLYVSPLFKRFIAGCVGEDRVFEYADPLAGLVATILPTGGRYPWHYDTNEFVCTLVIQKPENGGRFEFCRDLRRPGGDENLDGLRRVLAGCDEALIQSTNNQPGDLQLFRGRYSLHRVTPVVGPQARHVLVLSYADRPGVIGPVDRTRSVYGRVTEAHLVAAEARCMGADGLIL